MLNITAKMDSAANIDDQLVLTFDIRQKSRFRATMQSGKEAAVMLERGGILRGGDILRSDDGAAILVVAAPQKVMTVTASDEKQLARAAYHLGNRHVPLQIDQNWLRLEEDYVLRQMLEGLGVTITEEIAPFEPEAGAYGGGHRHGD